MGHIVDGLAAHLIDDAHFILEWCCHREQKTKHNNGCRFTCTFQVCLCVYVCVCEAVTVENALKNRQDTFFI